MAYTITHDYIPFGQSRSGEPIDKVRFIVCHATGNPGSTAQANVNWYRGNPVNASAHTFVDDVAIINDIPLDEKAWHVRYNVWRDNAMFGCNANDAAIGVEFCFGGSIDFDRSYARYVWYMAYLCEFFGLNPAQDIVAHSTLDPLRRSDPESAFRRGGVTWNDFIDDVVRVFNGGKAKHIEHTTKLKGERIQLLLNEGDKGANVRELQKKLKARGFYDGNIDGVYGPKTEKAVRKFQRANGLNVDGIAGPHTLGKLEALASNSAVFTLNGRTYEVKEVD